VAFFGILDGFASLFIVLSFAWLSQFFGYFSGQREDFEYLSGYQIDFEPQFAFRHPDHAFVQPPDRVRFPIGLRPDSPSNLFFRGAELPKLVPRCTGVVSAE